MATGLIHRIKFDSAVKIFNTIKCRLQVEEGCYPVKVFELKGGGQFFIEVNGNRMVLDIESEDLIRLIERLGDYDTSRALYKIAAYKLKQEVEIPELIT